MLRLTGPLAPSRFRLTASSDRWSRIEKLRILGHVAVRAKRRQVSDHIIPLLAPLDLVVQRQVLK